MSKINCDNCSKKVDCFFHPKFSQGALAELCKEYSESVEDDMSERSCDNCISWDKAINACGNILVSDAHPDKHSNLSKWLASICRHYSKRVELCGARSLFNINGVYVNCEFPKGHDGQHWWASQACVDYKWWHDHIKKQPSTPELCGGKCTTAGAANLLCGKPKGHEGCHCDYLAEEGEEITWDDPTPHEFLRGLEDKDDHYVAPTPTALDEAWETEPNQWADHKELFKKGWQARGKADKEVLGFYGIIASSVYTDIEKLDEQ